MAVKIRDLVEIIEAKAPLSLKEEWDRPGLELGDPLSEITGITVGMDVTASLIAEAAKQGANVLLTHHPFLFFPPETITAETSKGRKIRTLIKGDIAVYSAHTNLDKAKAGMNEKIMDLLGFQNFSNIEAETEEGIGRIAEVEPTELLQLVQRIEKVLEAGNVRFIGEPGRPVTRVAVINGGGADFIGQAMNAGADCIITGDTKYHEVLDASEDGLAVIDPGHFHTEWNVFRMFVEEVEREVAHLGNVPFHYSKTTQDPYQYYRP